MARKRANGEGMIRKRTDGSWEARFSFLDAHGRMHTKSFYGKTRAIAVEKMQKAQELLRRGDLESDEYKKMTLNDWIVFWLVTFKRPNVEFNTLNSYASTFANNIQNDIGQLNIHKISPTDVQLFINTLASKTPRIAELAKLILRDTYKMAVNFGYTKNNPTLYIILPKRKNIRESRALDKEQQKRYIDGLTELPLVYQLLAYLPLSNGFGPGEMLAITWDDIDLANKTISINKSYKHGVDKNFIGTTKTPYRNRQSPINNKLANLLEQVPDKYGFLFKGVSNGKKPTPEKPMNLYLPTKFIKDYLISINLGEFHLYDLRHTFATRCMESNIPEKVLQSWMGHGSSAMLRRVYLHANDDFKTEQAKKLDEIF